MKVVPMNITMREGSLLLVNVNFALHKEDKSDLVSAAQSYPEILVKKKVSEVLQQVFQKIGCEEHIVPVSGYRSVEEQTQIYETSLRENGENFTQKFVALPYHSEHQTGLAIDLDLKKEKIDFICPHSQIMREKDMTLEEYLLFVKQFSQKKPYVWSDEDEKMAEIFCVGAEIRDIAMPDNCIYQISGNNMDGFVVTLWRCSNE